MFTSLGNFRAVEDVRRVGLAGFFGLGAGIMCRLCAHFIAFVFIQDQESQTRRSQGTGVGNVTAVSEAMI